MEDLDLEEVLENLYQCRRCGICREAVYEDKGFDGICPVWRNSSGFETDFMRGRIQVAIALLEGELEKTQDNAESLYTCTLCGNCSQICAAEFDPAHSLEKIRHALVDLPNVSRDRLAAGILARNTPYEEARHSKRDWVKELDFDVPTQGETLYFAGCTTPEKIPHIAVSTAKILKKVGIDFAVLEEEPCCGSVLLRTGSVDVAEDNLLRLNQAISDAGSSRVVVSCAGCLRTLRQDYAMHIDVEVFHVIELLSELVQKGEVQSKPLRTPRIVTYHDPCHLGRELGIYEPPRIILRTIPNLELVEMKPAREHALCCGAGGGVRSYDSDLAKRIAADRVKTAESTGADTIATTCPFCELNLRAGTESIKSKTEVVDVLELLWEALDTNQ